MQPDDNAHVVAKLTAAASSEVPNQVEEAVTDAYHAGLPPEIVPALIELLALDWHTRHEDIVRALQKLRDPQSVGILLETATRTFEYLDYDEFQGLARKCTWALADIGTAEARSALETLSKSVDSLIAEYAQKRLNGWQTELHRKNGETIRGSR